MYRLQNIVPEQWWILNLQGFIFPRFVFYYFVIFFKFLLTEYILS